MIAAIAVPIVALTSILLFAFGLNLLYLTVRALRHPCLRFAAPPEGWSGAEPMVCVQVPIYNERYVAERVIDSVCELDWPRDRFEVQVLDDSDDETVGIVAARAARWRAKGVAIEHVRRAARDGFKAGALAYGLTRTKAPFIAIFDADFVPPRDFLRRTMTAFDAPRTAFAQARWGHLDETYSLFTRLQAMAIDFHFLVEQPVRSSSGFFTNFTGTAGVWRRAAIEDAGGWSARTLTEDLDLSYRAQLRGWRPAYLEDMVVPEELPVSIDAYRRQQSRWATGSFQTALHLVAPVLRGDYAAGVKVQAVFHLLAYGVGPLMLLQLACYPLLLAAGGALKLPSFVGLTATVAIFVGVAPWIGFIAAQTRRGRRWWTGTPALLCQLVGAGMSVNTLFALARAFRPGGTFERTPKHRIVGPGQEWRDQAYVRVGDARVLVEAIAALASATMVPIAIQRGQLMIAVYAGMFAIGFAFVAALSVADLLQVLTLRRLGAGALARLRTAGPAVALLAGAAVLFLSATRLREPFEDGFGHWLIAANLATTGALRDPLFGMEDTWLPGYQVLAAALLHVTGLWQLDALKVFSAVLAVGTAACVYFLAPSARQGRLAVGLLVLNPVFLFTSGSAVAEPLLTALLSGAALAAVRSQMKLAALLAALACATSTKAWIWVAAAAAYALFELVRARSRARTLAWALPAAGVLVFLQLGFAPASHSVARGSLEVVSATARGSLQPGALGRVLELAATYGLAALPIAAFVVVAAAVSARRQPAALWRYLYVPAAVYLAAVFALVAAGAYTGSHRYLYPALPAAALLAASALDRYAFSVRLGSLAAAAMLPVAFLPVFTGFGDADAGLVAAGVAARATPGAVLTDSPVAAYYSAKPPADIFGSRSLPPARDGAIAWLRAHGITSLVLEDISYYNATAVFPELARGQAAPPFVALGSERAYEVPGGKPVYAFLLPPAVSMRSTAAGKTAVLAKGMTLGPAGTGEGMGFGVPIVQYGAGWVYPRTATTVALSSTSWERTFQLDEAGGDAAHRYRFVPIPSRGAIAVTYSLQPDGVAITVAAVALDPGYSQVGILNEQAAAFDELASDAPVGLGRWTAIDGTQARLRAGSLGIAWSVPSLAGATLYAGRELAPPDFDWAGLDYMFPAPFSGATYRISLQEAK